MAKQPAQVFQIKVTLDGVRPPIWRRILAPGTTTLLKFHDILQSVMGWQDSHLHRFTIDGQSYGNTEIDEWGDLGIRSEARYKLGQLISEAGARFHYEYDFGDSWEHTLLVEKIQPPKPGERYPLCLAGKRACPPEDVGGVWGYQTFLEAISNPKHAEHEEYLEWVGGEFDPDFFDVELVNAQLRQMGRGRSAEAASAWATDDRELDEGEIHLDSAWARALAAGERATAENLALRRDMLTLLTYLRDNRVSGTPGTGNLPLKAVHGICARFVHPPILEHAIGDHVYRARSEWEVWPLYYSHVLASVAGLVAGGPGRRWRLTPLGERFLAALAPLQVWLMFATWWTQVNWAMASPWSYGDGEMPPGFTGMTLKRLLALPTGEPISFEPFADRLITEGPLVWPIQDQENARTILHSIVERVVVGPLRDFGILAAEYGPDRILGPRYQELVAFRVTPFGRGLLAAIRTATR